MNRQARAPRRPGERPSGATGRISGPGEGAGGLGERAVAHRAARLFKALADPLRLRLLALTRSAPSGSVCFCDLAAHFDVPQSSLSHHLRVLVDAELLDRERRGTWSWYSVRPDTLALLHDSLPPAGPVLERPSCCDEPVRPPGGSRTRHD
ncbi:MAG TPA: metalloregulator ArsR/SmtB family transcription factor [Pseudonocardiaceae bacterium]